MSDYDRIAKVIRYLEDNYQQQPDLGTLAQEVGLSQYHFHRLFSRWAGVTPKDFVQCLTVAHARQLLRQGDSVLDSALDAGLSGPSRLHDLCVSLEAATPGEVKSGGAGWQVTAGFADTPFGPCLIGESPRGVCHISFVDARDRPASEAEVRNDWPQAELRWSNAAAERLAQSIFDIDAAPAAPLRAIVRGTEFQVRVWRALLRVPPGALVSYGQLADTVCTRDAARAVGSAVGANRLAYLIPCHRVIRETGVFGHYRWDATRKRAIVAWEALRTSPSCDEILAERVD